MSSAPFISTSRTKIVFALLRAGRSYEEKEGVGLLDGITGWTSE
jgi:hypothetical protein